MDEQQDSSMGLIIAIVVGGVVLVLVALLVVGGGFFFIAWHRDVAFAPVAIEERAPDMVMVENGPAPIAPPGAEIQAKPAVKDAAPRTRLIGVWEAKTKEGGRVTLEFAADDTYSYVAVPPKGGAAPASVASWRWELVSHQDNQAVIHRIDGGKASPRETVAFNDDGSITLSGADCYAPGRYQRKEEKKP